MTLIRTQENTVRLSLYISIVALGVAIVEPGIDRLGNEIKNRNLIQIEYC